jgi:hypothetical protein
MEAVEDVKRLGALFADDLQIRFPHIGADEADLRGEFIADHGEESAKGFDGPLSTHPEQAGGAEVDLINKRQVLMTFGVLDFIDSDGIDPKTLSHEVRKLSATSFHESRRAQRAKNSMQARVRVRLPSPHGTSSTTTASQRGHWTRRIE